LRPPVRTLSCRAERTDRARSTFGRRTDEPHQTIAGVPVAPAPGPFAVPPPKEDSRAAH